MPVLKLKLRIKRINLKNKPSPQKCQNMQRKPASSSFSKAHA